ncbi:MAG: sterol desaturase/sphingolipid hydroxylase (fatty acid hydroxylase superfamily) [Oleiphilaceae bacterium]|jgi:sterol desaturase/sphingolipid hydroxylase (fatty acid hydroxylase superfamily)
MSEEIESIAKLFLETFLLIADPNSRVYFVYLLSSLLIAALVYWFGPVTRSAADKTSRSIIGGIRFIFPIKIWLHKSTAIDVMFLFLNAVLKSLVFIPMLMSSFTIGFYTVKGLRYVFGMPVKSILDWPDEVIVVSYTVVLILASDLMRYFLHRLFHEIPLLWSFHKLHHSAEVMTPLTLYRSHPIEVMLSLLRDFLTIGLVSGVFFYVFGESVDAELILGVNAGRFIFNLAGANLRHSHVWLSYGQRLEKIFISPAQHQIHHSDNFNHYNKNYGSQFALWDWIFGTLYVTNGREKLTFGLKTKNLS